MGNDGCSLLAQVIAERISHQTQQPNALELGIIQGDMGLAIDKCSVPIPRGEYLVCRRYTLPNPMTVTVSGQGNHPHGPSGEHTQATGTGVHEHPGDEGAHVHQVVCPPELEAIKPGDRVLVAWVNDGRDPVIVDVVVNL